MTVTPANLDLVIYQDATFSQSFAFQDSTGAVIDLTGKKAKMMVRQNIYDVTPQITLTTENGGITNGGTTGVLTLNISSIATAALAIFVGVYDLYLVNSSVSPEIDDRYLMGKCTISASVTR